MNALLTTKAPRQRHARRATSGLDIALIVTTYQRPRHLKYCLESIASQRDVDGRFEVVVADDGSTDETPRLVENFARRANFPVSFTTEPRKHYHVSRCRNRGVAASSAPYLQFVDGDCILPPDSIHKQLRHRRKATCWTGFYLCLDQTESKRLTVDSVRAGEYLRLPLLSSRWDLSVRYAKSYFYRLTLHPKKPGLIGGNASMWRTDFEAINGYDERFRNWGCEDDDLGRRLRGRGIRVRSNLGWMRSYHIWHPTDPTKQSSWNENANAKYLDRKGSLICCRKGLRQRDWRDVRVSIVGQPGSHPLVGPLLGRLVPHEQRHANPEVELLVAPGGGRFSQRAECKLLLALEDSPAARRNAQHADVVLSNLDLAPPAAATFKLAEIDQALDIIG